MRNLYEKKIGLWSVTNYMYFSLVPPNVLIVFYPLRTNSICVVMYHGAILISLAVKLNCTNALSGIHIYIHITYTIYIKPLTNKRSIYTTYESYTYTYCCKYMFLHYIWLLNGMVRLYQLLNETVYYERIDGFCLYIQLTSVIGSSGWMVAQLGRIC